MRRERLSRLLRSESELPSDAVELIGPMHALHRVLDRKLSIVLALVVAFGMNSCEGSLVLEWLGFESRELSSNEARTQAEGAPDGVRRESAAVRLKRSVYDDISAFERAIELAETQGQRQTIRSLLRKIGDRVDQALEASSVVSPRSPYPGPAETDPQPSQSQHPTGR